MKENAKLKIELEESEEDSQSVIFDEMCREYQKLELENEDIQGNYKANTDRLKVLDVKIRDFMDRGIKGRDWNVIDEVARRRIGDVAEPEVEELMRINTRFVRRGVHQLTIHSENKFEIQDLNEELSKRGLVMNMVIGQDKPETLQNIEKIFNEIPSLGPRREEVFDLLNIIYTKKLKIFPTILNTSGQE